MDKIQIKETSNGLLITNTIEIEPINKTVSLIAALVLLITFYMEFQVINILPKVKDTPIFVFVFLGLMLIFLIFWQKNVLGYILFSFLNKETIECNNEQITIRKKWELFSKRRYRISKIYKARFDKPVHSGLMKNYNSHLNKFRLENISFRYGLEVMTFGVDVNESDTNYILTTLVGKGILKQEQV